MIDYTFLIYLFMVTIIDYYCVFVIKIVHNYGHGGSGISLQWGCALDSRKLIDELAKEIRVSSRL